MQRTHIFVFTKITENLWTYKVNAAVHIDPTEIKDTR